MNIGNRLKKLRKELDLTQEAFAARIGSVQNTITGYESGRRNPSTQVITLICREFHVNESWLRTGDGEMFVPDPQTELEALKNRYGLSDAACSLVDFFVNMNEKDQKIVLDFIVHAADSIRENDLFFDVPDTPEELEAKYPPVRQMKKNVG